MKYTMIVLLLSFVLCVSGCGEMSFEYVKEVTDQTVKAEITKPGKPVVLLIYGNPGSRSACGWGAVLEDFAQKYSDKLTFLHYNYKANGKWFKRSKTNPLGQIKLYKSGRLVDSLKEMTLLMNHEQTGLRGQVFVFLKDYISQKLKPASGEPIELSELLYEKKVVQGKGTSIIAFDKPSDCGG